MGSLLNLAGVLDRIARKTGMAAGWIMLPLIFVIVFDVVTRKVDFIRLYFSDFSIEYGYSVSTILQDLEWHLHGALLLLTFGFGYLMNAHVRVDIFRENLSRRKQAWFEFWSLAIMAIPFLTIMIIYSWKFVALSFHQGEGSESLTGIPWRYVIKSTMVIGLSIAMVAALATLARVVVYLFGTPDEKEAAHQALSIFAHEDPASRELEEAHAATERAAHEIKLQRNAQDGGAES